ncbi:MAG: hypothetical protein KKB45_01160 [Gammaproteobacteria bacterium]|jgi:hypothetical protein|nr:hypothetical protein [Gammaproteobacteria bacterium]MBU2277383.1 hypothetical protein [Gammaproteobacteria bacterium]MBU2426644.1 hypothetical protein [Gammaproteobacteria bacterium]
MSNTARSRIIQFLQISHCQHRIDGNRILLCNATLLFEDQQLCIERPGKPVRMMSYQKLNLDRLLYLVAMQQDKKLSAS